LEQREWHTVDGKLNSSRTRLSPLPHRSRFETLSDKLLLTLNQLGLNECVDKMR
jgi:hypothetical protein